MAVPGGEVKKNTRMILIFELRLRLSSKVSFLHLDVFNLSVFAYLMQKAMIFVLVVLINNKQISVFSPW
jgi:hypothetical protein